MNYIIPPIKLKGRFKVKAPLNTIINENIIYTVDSIKTIRGYLDEDIDVETLVYKEQNLTSDEYKQALKEDIPLVTLKTEGNVLYYIPGNYFTYMPQISGKIFKNKAIIINLGYIPIDYNIDFILEDVNDQITSMTGIESSSTIEDISGDLVTSYEDYDLYTSNLEARQNNKNTCRGLLEEARETIKKYKLKINNILNNINNKNI